MNGVTFEGALDGLRGIEAETVWALKALGLPELGKVPTAWFGRPLPVKLRRVPEQLQLHVATRVPAEE